MASSPFDRVLKNASAVDEEGNLSAGEKEKFTQSVHNFLKNGSSIPGLSFPPDPDADKTIERLKSSKSWNKTYVEGLLAPTVKSLDTPGNIPLFPVHDPSSTFGYDIDLNGLTDPTNFTPDAIALKAGATPPEIVQKLSNITSQIPTTPPVPQLPPIPTPEVMIDNFEINRADLSAGSNLPDVYSKKVAEITENPLKFFGDLFKLPLDVFKGLLGSIGETLEAIVDGTILSKILKIILDAIKSLLEKLGVVIASAIALVATVLAWAFKVVSCIAASLVSSIIGTGSISTSIYNLQLSS